MATFNEKSDGGLLSKHTEWLLSKIDKKSQDSSCICLPSVSSSNFVDNFREKKSVTRLIFVLEIGENVDGTVFIASAQNPGDHWVLVIAELANNAVLYCDSLARNVPSLLLESLSYYTLKLNLPSLTQAKLVLMHTPSTKGSCHNCTQSCKNYPLESHANAYGIMAMAMASLAALKYDYFKLFTGTYSSNSRVFLHDPGKYKNYIKQILISWYMQEDVDVSSLCEKSIDLEMKKIVDQTLDPGDRSDLKRKLSISVPLVPSDILPEKRLILTSSGSKNENADLERKKGYQCPHCECVLARRQSLSKHKQRLHKDFFKTKLPTYRYCTICSDFKTVSIQDLIRHYRQSHNQDIHVSTKTFLSVSEYKTWKKEVETATSSLFIQQGGSNKLSSRGVRTSYLYCRRTGTNRQRGNCSKSTKSKRSCKIGNKCTAYMIERINQLNGSVTVEYCLQHNGHSFEPQHHIISDKVRFKVAEKLCQGVEIGKILQEIKEETADDHNKRDSLLTRKDIHNIKKQFKIFCKQQHRDDWQSVNLWVQNFQKKSNNPIIYYKAQNSPHEVLGEQDFLLCVQTDFQRSVLLEQKSRTVCVDSSMKATNNDFYLTTVLVLDEFDEGIPIAWAISNREDLQTLELFFIALKNTCERDIESEAFLGDLADVSYSAWCQVFSSPSNKLYCSWHVDKNWRQKVNTTIQTEKDQSFMHSCMKELLRESDKTKFTIMLKDFVAYLNENAPSLADYFVQNFVKDDRFYLWAGCYRKGRLASTYMFVEPFHRVLKEMYLSKVKNKRVDSLLSVLLKLGRDKALDELMQSQNERVLHQIRERKEESQVTSDLPRPVITPDNISIRRLPKRRIILGHKTQCNCKVLCDLCALCIHWCSCSRMDLVCNSVSSEQGQAIQKTDPEKPDNGGEEFVSSNRYCSDTGGNEELPTPTENIEDVRAAFVQEMSDLLDFSLQCKDIGSLKMMHTRVREIKKLVSDKM